MPATKGYYAGLMGRAPVMMMILYSSDDGQGSDVVVQF